MTLKAVRLQAIVLAVICAVSCGLQGSRFVDYKAPADELDLLAGEPCDFGVFLEQVQPALSRGCAGCHNATHPLPFSATEPLKNYTVLDNLLVSFAEKIYEQNGVKHGGGNQRTVLPEANVEAWQAARAKCE